MYHEELEDKDVARPTEGFGTRKAFFFSAASFCIFLAVLLLLLCGNLLYHFCVMHFFIQSHLPLSSGSLFHCTYDL